MTPHRRRPPSAHTPAVALTPATRANELWTTDFKGEFRTGDGVYCDPLTVRDGFSRVVLRCDGLLGRTGEATQRRFARAFAEYGLPDRIRSDKGGPFASPGLGGLSALSVWWIRLGILPERIAPGHPEQNGSHEQCHRVLKAETARLPPVDYPGHMDVRLVRSNGCVSWTSAPLFVATPLAGHYVAFEELDDGFWTLHFATVALARYDERHRSIHPIAFRHGRARAVRRTASLDSPDCVASASFAGSAPNSKNGNQQ